MGEIFERTLFRYSITDLLKEYCCCYCMRKKNSWRNKIRFRRQYLFEKGLKKLNNNFDALSLLKSMQLLQLISPILFDPSQKLMMNF